jgi:hypothetical protein
MSVTSSLLIRGAFSKILARPTTTRPKQSPTFRARWFNPTSPITPRRVDERPVHNAKGEMWKKNVIAMLAMMMILTGHVFGHNGRPKNRGINCRSGRKCQNPLTAACGTTFKVEDGL